MLPLRKSVLALAGIVFVSTIGPVHAVEYPWCAVGTGVGGASSNCSFTTFEQCQATTRGAGGFCQQNSSYTGGNAGATTKRKAAKQRMQN